ncbi:MAG: hypothetical protein ACOZDY_13505 [Pseudomonadota bacterium]
MTIEDVLQVRRPLPSSGGAERVVHWHVFRSAAEARSYAGNIILGAGQQVVGGWDEDSVGRVYWVGVEVDDLARWGNRAAVNKRAE